MVDTDAAFATDYQKKSVGFSMIVFGSEDGSTLFMLLDWNMNVQGILAMSSMGAEIIEQSSCGQGALVVLQILEQRGWDLSPYVAFCDNSAGVTVLSEAQNFKKSGHILRHYYHVRDMKENGILKFIWISTKEMLADFNTKFNIPVKVFLEQISKVLQIGE